MFATTKALAFLRSAELARSIQLAEDGGIWWFCLPCSFKLPPPAGTPSYPRGRAVFFLSFKCLHKLLLLDKRRWLQPLSRLKTEEFESFCLPCSFKKKLKSCPSWRGTRTFFWKKSSEGVLSLSHCNKPCYARKTPPSSKTVVFESTSPLRAGTFLVSYFVDIPVHPHL